MRTLPLTLMALFVALALVGCGQRTHGDVQQDIAAAAEELAEVLDSDLPHEEKLARVEQLADRLEGLVEEARLLGEPPDFMIEHVEATRERELAAARKLLEAADKLAD